MNRGIGLMFCSVLLLSCKYGSDVDRTSSDENIIEKVVVFRNGEGGYANFRIPAAVISKEGTILAFAEGRVNNRNDYGDIDVVLKRSEDNGKTWSDIIVVAEDAGNRCANPVPVTLDSGEILLVYSWSKTGEEDTVDDEVYTVFSCDDGKTWGESVNITDQIKNNGAGETNYHSGPVHGIVKTFDPAKGRIIVPVWGRSPRAFVIYSDDEGQTWHQGGYMDYPNSNESTVVELGNGDIVINTRNSNKDNYYRYEAVSKDGGITFGPVVPTSLVEPATGCQGSLIRHSVDQKTGETILLFSNPNHKSSRRHGTVKVSYDSGKTWSRMFQFVPDDGNAMYVAYSDMVIIGQDKIGVFYEEGYQQNIGIVFKTIDFADISQPIL